METPTLITAIVIVLLVVAWTIAVVWAYKKERKLAVLKNTAMKLAAEVKEPSLEEIKNNPIELLNLLQRTARKKQESENLKTARAACECPAFFETILATIPQTLANPANRVVGVDFLANRLAVFWKERVMKISDWRKENASKFQPSPATHFLNVELDKTGKLWITENYDYGTGSSSDRVEVTRSGQVLYSAQIHINNYTGSTDTDLNWDKQKDFCLDK